MFTAGRWLTAFAIWAINYALTFGIARSLLDPAAQVATGYQDAVQRSGLIWVFLVLAVAYAGWHALRGRLAHGLGETLVSFLIATLLAGILAAPATTLLGKDGLLDRTRDISLALAGITLNPERPDTQRGGTSTEISAPMMAKLQHTLVDIPHQVLNWGDVLEGPGSRPKCLKTHRKLLDDGPWGDADKPREEMKAAGCSDLAKFNEHGSADRLIAAVLVLLAVILACALMALMAFTVIGAQFVLALLAAFTPLALAAGLLPGSGRQVLWRWASAVLRTLAGVIMTVAALSVVITLATAILRADADMPLAVRMGLLDIFMITAFVFRRRLLDAGRRAAAGVGRRLESVRIGGTGGRGMMPAGSAVAAAEAWGQHHQRALGTRARHELRQMAHTRYTNHAMAQAVRTTAASQQHNPSRPAASKTGRAVQLTGKAATLTGKTVLAATIGTPVYLPRAAKAAKIASNTKAQAVRKRLATTKSNANAFRNEYVHGLGAPVRLVTGFVRRTDQPNSPHQPPPKPGQPSKGPARRGPLKTPDTTPPRPNPKPTTPRAPQPTRRKQTPPTTTRPLPNDKASGKPRKPKKPRQANPAQTPQRKRQPARKRRTAMPDPRPERGKARPPKRPSPPPDEQARPGDR